MNDKLCPFCGSVPSCEIESGLRFLRCVNTNCPIRYRQMMETEWNTRPDGWIQVKDGLPEILSRDYYQYHGNDPVIPYLVWNGEIVRVARYEGNKIWKYFHTHHPVKPEITHWIQLPDPPKDDMND